MKQKNLVRKLEKALTNIFIRHDPSEYWHKMTYQELEIFAQAEQFIITTIEKEKMDKEIKKVSKKIMGAKKETSKLMKMDKKQDKKIAKAKKVMKKKGKC